MKKRIVTDKENESPEFSSSWNSQSMQLSSRSRDATTLWERFRRKNLSPAHRLLADGGVIIDSIDSSGTLHASIYKKNKAKIDATLLLLPEGHILADSMLLETDVLAILLMFMTILRSKKRSKQRQLLLSTLPSWLDDSFRFKIIIEDEILDSEPSKNQGCFELEAYRVLRDMAVDRTAKIPVEFVLDHLMSKYSSGDFILLQSALEALLSRIAVVEKEGLRIGARPESGLYGIYRVRRFREKLRPYEILIWGSPGLKGSCSCPDFAKNTLSFCKHIAAVYHENFAKPRLEKQLMHSIESLTGARLLWAPPLGLKKVEDPLDGLYFVVAARGRRYPPKGLIEFFSRPNGSFWQLVPIESQSPMERLTLLNRLSDRIGKSRNLTLDPAVPGMIQREIDRVHWRAAYANHSASFESIIDSLPLKLYPYQREGVLSALSCGRFLLGDDMGLGKTTQGIAWAECLLNTGIVKRVAVICPASLKSQWRREWSLVSGRNVKIVDGTAFEREAIYASEAQVLLINYELVTRDFDNFPRHEFDAVILDEAQRIKNFATQTAKTIKRLEPPFRLILTGTPMENRLSEFASLMDWIDSHAFGPHWRLNAETTVSSEHGRGHKSVRGLNLIRQRIEPYFLRRTRKEVLSQLPDRTDSLILVDPTDEQLEVHRELAAIVSQLMAIAEKRPLTPEQHLRLMSSLTKMRIVSNGLAQYEFEGYWESIAKKSPTEKILKELFSPKLGIFRNLIEGLLSQPDLKIVVFSQWRKALRLAHWAISDLLQLQGAEAVFFTGSENQARRTENIVRFHDEPRVRVFFATDAGGVGLNLQRAASVCINFELPWNPAVLEQRIARIHRIGQSENIQVFNLVTQNTIEARITELIANKRAVFSALLDEGKDEVLFDQSTSFMNQIKAAVTTFASSETILDAQDLDTELNLEEIPAGLIEDAADTATSVSPKAEAENGPPLPAIEQAPEWKDTKEILIALMRSVSIDRTANGRIRIEADGPAAELFSEVFANLSTLFKKSGPEPVIHH
ncbi:MAG: DEAD/DEAH box helicase [Oligoflexus sp.]|nr:DEAD/DEAH box helicase [Oligoflexus sp.]